MKDDTMKVTNIFGEKIFIMSKNKGDHCLSLAGKVLIRFGIDFKGWIFPAQSYKELSEDITSFFGLFTGKLKNNSRSFSLVVYPFIIGIAFKFKRD